MYSRARKGKEHVSVHQQAARSASSAPRARTYAIFVALCFLAVIWQLASQPSSSLPHPIVTLATTKLRVSRELPYALRTLLTQSLLPSDIWVHISRDDRDEVETLIEALPSATRALFAHPRVSLRYVKDVGPATKLIPALSKLLEEESYSTPLVVLDDDHIWHYRLLEDLTRGHIELGRTAAVGARGWRIRRDLRWGVAAAEYDRHVHLGCFIKRPYRAGILTANEAYIVLPSYFATNSCDPSAASQTPTKRPAVLTPSEPGNPDAAHLVDDIWINGQLSRNCISRYIVPMSGANIDVTKTHVLDGHMRDDGISRARANDLVLRFFKDDWEREDVWYELGGKGEQPVATWSFSQWLVTFEKGWRWFWGR